MEDLRLAKYRLARVIGEEAQEMTNEIFKP
jgi:hypothetical protein